METRSLVGSGCHEAKRVVREHRRRDEADQLRVEIGSPGKGVDRVAAGERDGDRVDREVTRCEVLLDRPGQRCEVDRPAVRERDAPRTVPVGERERRASGALGVRARRRLRLADGDVQVDELPSEQLVPHRAADDPGLLAREQLPRELTHRSPRAGRGWGRR